MNDKPSPEGVKRYRQHGHCEDGYYIADSGERIPCTCAGNCDDECEGECGCEACARCALDIAHGE